MRDKWRKGISLLVIGVVGTQLLMGCSKSMAEANEIVEIQQIEEKRQADDAPQTKITSDRNNTERDLKLKEESPPVGPFFCGTPDMMNAKEDIKLVEKEDLQDVVKESEKSTEITNIVGMVMEIDNQQVRVLIGDVGEIYENVDNAKDLLVDQIVEILEIQGGYIMKPYFNENPQNSDSATDHKEKIQSAIKKERKGPKLEKTVPEPISRPIEIINK